MINSADETSKRRGHATVAAATASPFPHDEPKTSFLPLESNTFCSNANYLYVKHPLPYALERIMLFVHVPRVGISRKNRGDTKDLGQFLVHGNSYLIHVL